MTYEEDCGAIRSDDGSDIWIRPYALEFPGSEEVELEVDGDFVAIPVAWIPEVIQCLSEGYRRATDKELQMSVDARRYQFLRVEDNWGEDSGDDCWERLGESSAAGFDEIVDSRMSGGCDD